MNKDKKIEPLILNTKNISKVIDGDIQIIQPRNGCFMVIEYKNDKPKIKFPKLLSICQLCGNKDCKNIGKKMFFSKCSIYKNITIEEINLILNKIEI